MIILKKTLKYFFFLNFLLLNIFSSEDKRHTLYLMHSNEIEKAFSEYQKYSENQPLDLEILQKMSLILLKNGAKSSDLEVQNLSMFGAGLCASNISLDILEIGLNSPSLDTQLLSLHFISLLNDNKTDKLLSSAMRSDFLPTRLEAAYHMAIRKHPHAIGQIEALMYRLPPFIKPFFPHLFATIGTDDATKYLLKFLNDSNQDVRLETILSISNLNRDDLLGPIKKKILNGTIAEKEAICFAVSKLNDTSCKEDLNKLTKSNIDNVTLASLKALYNLGDKSKKEAIENLALENNLFAISTLKEIPNSENVLLKLINSKNRLIRINAAISLLKHKHPNSVDIINEILVTDAKDTVLEPFFSIGRTMLYFKLVPLAIYKIKDIKNNPSLQIREAILKECIELDETSFFKIMDKIFSTPQMDLIPSAIALLENLSSEKAIDFLKEKAKNSIIPLIKDYASLSLYRLKFNEYEKYVFNWIKNQNSENIIQLNVNTDKKKEKKENIYNLTSQEKTRLLLDMYIALASKQDEKSLKLIIEAIKKTNPKNRYALAGMLIRATQ